MEKKKTAAIVISITFLIIVFSALAYYDYQRQTIEKIYGDADPMALMHQRMASTLNQKSIESTLYLTIIIILVGILIGIAVYYFMEDEVDKKENIIKSNSEIVLNFLNKDEKDIINKILQNGGEIKQYELTHSLNKDKVRIHRALNSLEKKGIIMKERLGKVNRIYLDKDILDFFLQGKQD